MEYGVPVRDGTSRIATTQTTLQVPALAEQKPGPSCGCRVCRPLMRLVPHSGTVGQYLLDRSICLGRCDWVVVGRRGPRLDRGCLLCLALPKKA
jgi:hypothetical protein